MTGHEPSARGVDVHHDDAARAPASGDSPSPSPAASTSTASTSTSPASDLPRAQAMVNDDAPRLPGTDEAAFSFGLLVVVAALFWGLATYLILTGLTPIIPRGPIVAIMVSVNLILIGALIAIIWVQIHGLWTAWKEKIPGARLHGRVVALFSLIALLPALTLATGATVSFSRGLDTWFGKRTLTIVSDSMEVANAYLEEHGGVIRSDVINMAKDLDDAARQAARDPKRFRDLLFSQAGLRDIPVAYVINSEAQVLVAAIENDKIPYIAPPKEVFTAAQRGQVPLLYPSNPTDLGRVSALIQLKNYPDSYLYVARGVSPKVLRHLRLAQAGVADYEELRSLHSRLKFIHGLMYYMIALTALSTAIWAGLWFASQLVAPIRRLISAAQLVARGNLDVILPLHRGEGDMRRLSMNFNNMTQQLQRQRADLVTANSQLTERSAFIEAVLTGVSAGVLGIDDYGRITIANRSTERLIGRAPSNLIGQRLVDVLPEFAPLLQTNAASAAKKPQTEVVLEVNGEHRTFATRLVREEGLAARSDASTRAAVITFDDITDLVVAQRTSAWADMARRLAHEIKNPLTPIQLSAERLKRRYAKAVEGDSEVFDKCTDTIIRQVGDVTRMVDEFSSFARMPKPEMMPCDLREALKDPVNLFQMSSNGSYDVALTMPTTPVSSIADVRLLSQALTNLVKNATESVQAVAESKDKPEGYRGRVETSLRLQGETAIIEIIDNGTGLPKQNRARLLEPYVTTKGAKGTGLGLAIVQKIVEAHGGSLSLEDAPPTPTRPRGALLRVILPLQTPVADRDPKPVPVDDAVSTRPSAAAAS